MSETEKKPPESSSGSESLGDVVSEIIFEVGDAVESLIKTVVEAVEEVAENVIGTTAKDQSNQTKTETTDQNQETNLRETRVGYAAFDLPLSDEAEAEAAIEADDKDEIEAQIARARETGTETAPEKRDPLVADTLPALPRFNRARLDVQSPNRIFLYYSLSGNPYETLSKAIGARAANYVLVTRLVNLATNAESFASAEYEGNWWYNVRSGASYRVDVGFYSNNRPFVRLLSSNAVTTPRAAPSLRGDTAADWAVTTPAFTEVLQVSGYAHDVARVNFLAANDDETIDETATLKIADDLGGVFDLTSNLNPREVQSLLIALAAEIPLEDLRALLSDELTWWLDRILQTDAAQLESANVRRILETAFGTEFVETMIEDLRRVTFAPVFGASIVNFGETEFPARRVRRRRIAPADFPEIDFDRAFAVSSEEFLN